MKRKWSALCLIAVFLLCACAQNKKSDMSGYEGFEDTDHVFTDMSVKDAVSAINSKETFVLYFGYETCPLCIEAVPVLNEQAKTAGMHVGYVDTRKDPSVQNNTEMADYDLVLEYFGEYFSYDNDGIRHLYTPHVFFIREGQIVDECQGIAEGTEELADQYRKGFALLKKQN